MDLINHTLSNQRGATPPPKCDCFFTILVALTGFEPARLSASNFKSDMYTYFITEPIICSLMKYHMLPLPIGLREHISRTRELSYKQSKSSNDKFFVTGTTPFGAGTNFVLRNFLLNILFFYTNICSYRSIISYSHSYSHFSFLLSSIK